MTSDVKMARLVTFVTGNHRTKCNLLQLFIRVTGRHGTDGQRKSTASSPSASVVRHNNLQNPVVSLTFRKSKIQDMILIFNI